MLVARSSCGSISYQGPTGGVFMVRPHNVWPIGGSKFCILRNLATVWSEAIDGRRTSTRQKQRQVLKEKTAKHCIETHIHVDLYLEQISKTALSIRKFQSIYQPTKAGRSLMDSFLKSNRLMKSPAYRSVSNHRFEFYLSVFAFKGPREFKTCQCEWILSGIIAQHPQKWWKSPWGGKKKQTNNFHQLSNLKAASCATTCSSKNSTKRLLTKLRRKTMYK